ncbi:MAG TPA: rhodanese-like domain-containing protein, partial [Nitratifractor sp.]|nr:rhodanese-like domain-containing protein [Nitratifractor sp.]
GTLDFSKAKTVVVYCNGAWCLQSTQLIKDAKYSLLKLGYPKDKIKYYRGGMQSWVTFGLTTIGKGK